VADDKIKGMLGTGEVLLILTRQHWVAAIRYVIRPLLIFGLAILLALINQWLKFDRLGFINDIINWILIIALIVAVVWLPIDIVQWWSRRYVLTNRRAMRLQGVLRKSSFDTSLDQVNDIALSQSFLGRTLGYADLTLLTANASNEGYEQLLDGPQFKKAVLEAKDAIRSGHPLQALPEDLVVRGGTNAASIKAFTKSPDAAAEAGAAATATVVTTAAATVGIHEDVTEAAPSGSDAPEATAVAAASAPEPEMVEPEPVAPEPEMVAPEMEMAEPEPEPEMVASEPQPAMVEAEPEIVAPEMEMAAPEPEPEPEMVAPEPEPELEPEMAEAAPEMAEAEAPTEPLADEAIEEAEAPAEVAAEEGVGATDVAEDRASSS
jgi:hypothetical protein